METVSSYLSIRLDPTRRRTIARCPQRTMGDKEEEASWSTRFGVESKGMEAEACAASSSAVGSKRPASEDRAQGGAVKEQRQSIRRAMLLSLDASDKTSDQTRPEAKQPQSVGGREETNAIDIRLTQKSRSGVTIESKCIGRRVEVFWEQEGRWVPGVIIGRRNTIAFGQITGHMPHDASHAPRASRLEHHVAYDDGDEQWHHFEVNSKDPDSFRFRWLDAHTPAPEGGSSRDPVETPEPEAGRTIQPPRQSNVSTFEESTHGRRHSGERRKQVRAADPRTSNTSGKASAQMLDPSAPKKRRKGENLDPVETPEPEAGRTIQPPRQSNVSTFEESTLGDKEEEASWSTRFGVESKGMEAEACAASSSAVGSKRPASEDRAQGGAVKEQRQSIRRAMLLSLDASDKTSDQTRPEAKQPQSVGGREETNAIDIRLTQKSRSGVTIESKCIGRRVEVFWEQEGRWVPGVIIGRRNTIAFGQITGHMPHDASHAPRASRLEHHVAYDDGDEQWHHFEVNSKDPDSFRFRWLDAHTPAPEGGSSRDPVETPEPEAGRTIQPPRQSNVSTFEESTHGRRHSGERRKQVRAADPRTSNTSGKASAQMLDPSAPKKRRKSENLCEHQRRRRDCKHCLCEHQQVRSKCKDCNGGGTCKHQRKRSKCKDCGGGSFCEHQRRRSLCKECGGSSICEHQRARGTCKDCGGSGICEHQRRRSTCKDCGGGSICEHQRQRSTCKDCGGSSICEHQRVRSTCKDCGGGSICEHQRQRSQCKDCGGGGICEHNRNRTKCKDCGGGSLCEHQRQRSTCKDCKATASASTSK